MDEAPSPARPVPPIAETAWPLPVQLATIALAGLAGLLLLVQGLANRSGGARPAEAEEWSLPADRLDLNTAGAADLTQLPGVGPTLAERIVAFRQDHGPFTRVDDLGKVKGVGAALMARLRPCLVVEAAPPAVATTEASASPADEQPRTTSRTSKQPLAGPVNLNTAPEEQLRTLPGIGDKMARAIVEERGRRPFTSVEDLSRIRGFGPKTREKLRPHVTVTPAPRDNEAP